MAKKYGYRIPPGITYFRKGKFINYDGDIDDEEEVLDWLTDPENMELTDHIEKVNRKMFDKIRLRSDYVAAFLCKRRFYFDVPFLTLCFRQHRLQTMSKSAHGSGAHRRRSGRGRN